MIKQEEADKINNAKKNGKRVIAVRRTTSCRVLETIADENGMVKATAGDTLVYSYIQVTNVNAIDDLVTNFHLPESTLNNVSICISR